MEIQGQQTLDPTKIFSPSQFNQGKRLFFLLSKHSFQDRFKIYEEMFIRQHFYNSKAQIFRMLQKWCEGLQYVKYTLTLAAGRNHQRISLSFNVRKTKEKRTVLQIISQLSTPVVPTQFLDFHFVQRRLNDMMLDMKMLMYTIVDFEVQASLQQLQICTGLQNSNYHYQYQLYNLIMLKLGKQIKNSVAGLLSKQTYSIVVQKPKQAPEEPNYTPQNWVGLFNNSIFSVDMERASKSNLRIELLTTYFEAKENHSNLKTTVSIVRRFLREGYSPVEYLEKLTFKLTSPVQVIYQDEFLNSFSDLYNLCMESLPYTQDLCKVLACLTIKCFRQMNPLQKQQGVNLMLNFDFYHDRIFREYLKDSKVIHYQFDEETENRSNEFQYLRARLLNIYEFQSILPREEFQTHFETDIFEKLIDKYLQKLQDSDTHSKLIQYYSNQYIIIKALAYQNNVVVSRRAKERLAKIFSRITDFKENMQIFINPNPMQIPNLISNLFNKNDRYLLYETINNICLHKERYADLQIFLQKYQYASKHYMYNLLLDLIDKSTQINQIMIKQNYVLSPKELFQVMKILKKFVFLDNMRVSQIIRQLQQTFLKVKYIKLQAVFNGCFQNFVRLFLNQQNNVLINLFKDQENQSINDLFPTQAQIHNLSSKKFSIKKAKEDERTKSLKSFYMQHNQFIKNLHPFRTCAHKFQIQRIKTLTEFFQVLSVYLQFSTPNANVIANLNSFMNHQKIIQNINKFICVPKLLENLLKIKFQLQNKKNKIQFYPPLHQIVLNAKKQFQLVLKNIQNVTLQLESNDFRFDPVYQYFSTFSTNLPYLLKIYKYRTDQSTKFRSKKDFTADMFILNQQNIVNNLCVSYLINLLAESSQLKSCLQREIKAVQNQFKIVRRNHIQYPYFADFLIQTQKGKMIAVIVVDYTKYLVGIGNILTAHIQHSMEYFFKTTGSPVLEFTYDDYEIKKTIRSRLLKICE